MFRSFYLAGLVNFTEKFSLHIYTNNDFINIPFYKYTFNIHIARKELNSVSNNGTIAHTNAE